MIIVGVLNGIVDICVSITHDQLQIVKEMYPNHLILEQKGNEDIGWLFDGVNFTQG